MSTPEERELTAVLHRRAAMIEAAPQYSLEPEAFDASDPNRPTSPSARREWAAHIGTGRPSWVGGSGLARAIGIAAAGLLIVAGASAVIWRGFLDNRQPSTHVPQCASSGSSPFARALRAGALPAGDRVLAGGTDGTLLVADQRGAKTLAVRVVDPSGRTNSVWTAGPNDSVRATANRNGSIGSELATFVLVPAGRPGSPQAYIADVTGGPLTRLIPDSGYHFAADPRLAPVVTSDTPSVVEISASNPRERRLDTYSTGTVPQRSSVHISARNATALLAVGGNLVLLKPATDGATNVVFSDPRYRPTTLEPVARFGHDFRSDGTTMTWIGVRGSRQFLWRWAAGDPRPLGRAVPASSQPIHAASAQIVNERASPGHPQRVINLANRRAVDLPPGTSLTLLAGPDAVLAQQSAANVRYAVVPLRVLTAC